MPAAKYLLIPLDERPCTYDFPQTIAAIGEQSIAVPPRHDLGSHQRVANLKGLEHWLEHNIHNALGLLLSLDTWIYGGLVSSRRSETTLDNLIHRLHPLKTWHESTPIHGFATLMRISNSNDATEEAPYWATYGQMIYRFSVLEHQQQVAPTETGHTELEQLKHQIPANILLNYGQRRQRNLKLLEYLLDLVTTGVLQTLLLGYDDASSPYGWNVQERQYLTQQIAQRQLDNKVLLYPGADELASVLVARVLWPNPTPIQIRYTQPRLKNEITRYEGIPLEDTLNSQLQATGCKVAYDGVAVLYIHNAPAPQQDQFLEREQGVKPPPAEYQKWAQQTIEWLKTTPVAIADCYYANGGDTDLLDALEEVHVFWQLAGYTAWNTVGNTLGFALAWLKAYAETHRHQPNQAHYRCLAERLLDDGYYQGRWRQQLCEHYTQPVKMNDCLQLIQAMNAKLQQWQLEDPSQGVPERTVKRLTFPWKRFFEIDVAVCWPK